jgi:thioesterase domain-containing protein
VRSGDGFGAGGAGGAGDEGDGAGGDAGALARLTASLHAQIPLTAFLGISIAALGPARVALAAPLSPSRNHRGTAFGPGVFTVAGLAPWLLLVRRTWAARLPVQILLRRSELALHRAISSPYTACCDDLPMFLPEALAELRRGARVRLSASSQVRIDDGEAAATYTGHYTLVPVTGGDDPGGLVAAEGDLQLPFPPEWRA